MRSCLCNRRPPAFPGQGSWPRAFTVIRCDTASLTRKGALNWDNSACLGSNIGSSRSTFLVSKPTWGYPSLSVDATGRGVVSQAGAVALARTAQATGLTIALSTVLAPWRKPLASHDPGKIIGDLAISLAIGGDCFPSQPASPATPDEPDYAWPLTRPRKQPIRTHSGQHVSHMKDRG